jgi:hypothetical protein
VLAGGGAPRYYETINLEDFLHYGSLIMKKKVCKYR